MSVSKEKIDEILHSYPADQHYSLAIMQDLQHEFQYIPREGLEALVPYLNMPLSSLYSMATFYKALSLKPKGRHIIKLCDGSVTRLLGIKDGETTEDGLFSLELVNCLGSCALAPVMVVDDTYYGKMTMEKLPGVLDSYRKEG